MITTVGLFCLFVPKDCSHPTSCHFPLRKNKGIFLTCIYILIVNTSLILLVVSVLISVCVVSLFTSKACHFYFTYVYFAHACEIFKWLKEQVHSCHFKFHFQYCKPFTYSATQLPDFFFSLLRSVKEKWKKNDRTCVLQLFCTCYSVSTYKIKPK